MHPAILTDNLTKRFGDRVAVEGLSLEVDVGEIYGFLGPNGAGKTTTIGMLLGLVRPTAGRAALFGRDIWRDPAEALRNVGAMIEAPAFYPYLSGRDNLRVLARAGGLPPAAVEAALASVELVERARDRFRTYSQGMRQRLGIAAALLHEPQLIILDEPTSGLDPAGQIEIRQLVRSLAAGGRTVFLSSHMRGEVEQLCDRVTILKEGRAIAQGPVATLLRRGQGVVVRLDSTSAPDAPGRAADLLSALPWVAGVEHRGETLLVDAPSDRATEINALLVGHAIPVAEIRAQEVRLEDVFLELTR